MKFTPRERKLIAFGGAVVALTLLWVAVAEPAVNARQSLAARLGAEEKLLAWEQFLAGNRARIVAAGERQERLLARFRADGDEGGGGGDYVTAAVGSIQRLAGKAGLGLNEVRPQTAFPGTTAKTALKTTVLQITATGTLARFGSFLSAFESDAPAYEVTRLRINATQGDTLQFSLLVNVYAPGQAGGPAGSGAASEASGPQRGAALLEIAEKGAARLEMLLSDRVEARAYAALAARSIYRPAVGGELAGVKAGPGPRPSPAAGTEVRVGKGDSAPSVAAKPTLLDGAELVGVVVVGTTRFALVRLPGGDERYCREGDRVAGARVEIVGRDFVLLQHGSTIERLQLKDSFSVVPLAGDLSRGGN